MNFLGQDFQKLECKQHTHRCDRYPLLQMVIIINYPGTQLHTEGQENARPNTESHH